MATTDWDLAGTLSTKIPTHIQFPATTRNGNGKI